MRYLRALGFTCLSVAAAASSCAGGTDSTGPHAGSGGQQGTGGQGTSGGDTGGGIILIDAGNETCQGGLSCVDQGANCGVVGDGCGNTLDCGACALPEICGAAGAPNACAKPPCTPKTCSDQAIECGPAGDGCGGQIDCGACADPLDTCGGGGKPSVCGHAVQCSPKTCAALGINCGPAGDGCGGQIDCGATCPAGQSCGGGGQPGICGAPPCTPKTCADSGANCGPISDGCGALVQCGACSLPEKCGGAGTPSVCATPSSCNNLCLQQVSCPSPGVTTTLSGTVYAPNGQHPLPNALVYVPNAPVLPFTPGVSCDNCGAAASGSPLVSDVTAIDGKFRIKNAPVGTNIPLVIQIGRWRRQITVNTVSACVDNVIAPGLTRLPRNKAEGDIPLMAFATGAVDSLECVLRKIGIQDSEFTHQNGNGRIHLWKGSGSAGASLPGSGTENVLTASQANLNRYDILLFPCQGDAFVKSAAALGRLVNYANAGGRIFATHYSYVWFHNNPPFSSTAAWNVDQFPSFSSDPQTGYINTSFPKGLALAQWLMLPSVGASSVLGQIPIHTLRRDFDSVIAPSQLWIELHDPQHAQPVPMHYTFNTPVGAAPEQQCGRVVYDDFHVEDSFNAGDTFPDECNPGPMTPQEKMLELMLFDLASCVTPDIPTCAPRTCADLGAGCGPAGDGCGNLIDCGPCPPGQTCGGGGVASQCGTPTCTPKTCADLGISCGPAGDGCGNLISCGDCPPGQTCGGGGMPGVCGDQSCTPTTCAQMGVQCGPAGDGCGGLLQCGDCPPGQTCGGGGVPGVCGAPMCTPKTCADHDADCGPVADGCGHILQCGVCQAPQTCGGGGAPNKCGGNGPE